MFVVSGSVCDDFCCVKAIVLWPVCHDLCCFKVSVWWIVLSRSVFHDLCQCQSVMTYAVFQAACDDLFSQGHCALTCIVSLSVCRCQCVMAYIMSVLVYRNFRTISRYFFPQLLTLRLKQRMRLIYGFFSIRGASHTRLFLASFQLASKRRAAIRTCLCSVMFISKVSQKFISIFKYSVEWSIHNNF